MIDRVWLRGDRSWKIGQNIQISISLASIAILIFYCSQTCAVRTVGKSRRREQGQRQDECEQDREQSSFHRCSSLSAARFRTPGKAEKGNCTGIYPGAREYSLAMTFWFLILVVYTPCMIPYPRHFGKRILKDIVAHNVAYRK